MFIREFCNRDVVMAKRSVTVTDAARLMREYHVGDLVVIDELAGRRKPVGIVTDRDIVLEVVAMGLNASAITVGDVMGSSLAVAHENDTVFDAMRLMRARGVRRLPVVDALGALVGIVTLDDFLDLLAEEMSDLSKLISKERAREEVTRKFGAPLGGP